MIAQFTLIPLGAKGVSSSSKPRKRHSLAEARSDSLSKILSKAVPHIIDSGLPYKVGAMGTTVEGEWYQIMNLVNRCRKTILREVPRVEILLTIDDRKNAKNQIDNKVRSLEKKSEIKLKK